MTDHPPIGPPEPGMVLRICRWPSVFETSKTRGYKTLPRVMIPNSCDSSGYQQILDDFGEADGGPSLLSDAVYKAFISCVKLASRAPVRGYLAGDRGECITSRRIARLTATSFEAVEELIPWAIRNCWMEWARVGDPWPCDLCGVPAELLTSNKVGQLICGTCNGTATSAAAATSAATKTAASAVGSACVPATAAPRSLTNLTLTERNEIQPTKPQQAAPVVVRQAGRLDFESVAQGWPAVKAALADVGVAVPDHVIRQTQEVGTSPTDVLDVVAEYRQRLESGSVRGPGALVSRLKMGDWPQKPAAAKSPAVQYVGKEFYEKQRQQRQTG